MLAVGTVQAANITWDGGTGGTGTSWNDAANWGGDVLPSAADTVFFNNTGLPANTVISLGASQSVFTLSFNAYSNVPNFTIGSAADISAGNTLTLTNVFRGDNNGNNQTIAANVKLAADSTWNIINGYNGSVSVTGSIGSDSAVNFTKEGSNTLTVNGANTFTGNLRAYAGTLSLGGTNAYTGTTTASGGTVQLNFNTGNAPLTNIVSNSSALALGGVRGGGTLTASGKNLANVVNSQTFNGTTIGAGASTLNIVNGISSGKTLVDLGAISRQTGGTVNFVQPTVNTTISAQNGYVTSTGNDASGILGAWATVGGTEYATNNGTNIVAYTGYTDQVGNVLADGPTTNLRITSGTTGNLTQDAGTTTVNTLRVNDAAARTVTVGNGNTLRVNGVLATGTGGLTIGEAANAGSLTAGSADNTAGELVVINTTAVTVNSTIVDNGTGAVALTKAGAGTLTLGAGNTYTGGTTVNAGTLALGASSVDALSTTGAITVAGGTLNLGTGSTQTVTGPVIMAAGTLSNGTLTNNGTSMDARGGTISTKLAGSAGIIKTTSGALALTNTVANTFTGDTIITEGSVTGSSSNVISVSGNLIVGSVSGGGVASYSNNGSNVNFTSSRNVTVYSNGSVNFGSGAQNLSGTINILGGSLTGSQIYNQGATYNLTGGSLGGNFFVQGGTYNILASTATSTVSVNSGAGSKTFNVADGASEIDVAYTGTLSGANNLTKNGAGVMAASGNSSYTGITTVSAGTLSVTTLANAGANSAIGAASNAADRLRLANGTTFRYTGSGHSTDRLFTVNGSAADHSATLEASGTGAANFTNTGNIAWGTTAQTRTLKLGGTSTANNTLASTIANNGSGLVSLTKQNAGKWIISGTNTYTGATTINGGSLIVNGSLASGSAVTVNSGGTLGGSGTIGGSVTVESGGFLAPGNSPGILTVGSLNLASGSTTSLEIAGAAVRGTDFDGINVTTNSGLTYGGALNFDFTSTLTNGDVLDLFSFTGTAGGSFTSVVSTGLYAGTWNGNGGVWTFESNGQVLTFVQSTGDLSVTGSLIPEPSTYAVLVGLAALAVAGRRSRRRA